MGKGVKEKIHYSTIKTLFFTLLYKKYIYKNIGDIQRITGFDQTKCRYTANTSLKYILQVAKHSFLFMRTIIKHVIKQSFDRCQEMYLNIDALISYPFNASVRKICSTKHDA